MFMLHHSDPLTCVGLRRTGFLLAGLRARALPKGVRLAWDPEKAEEAKLVEEVTVLPGWGNWQPRGFWCP